MEGPEERSNHYRTLGLDPNSGEEMDQALINFAFKVMMKKKHPDRNGGTSEATRVAQRVNEARRVLGNPVLRAKYDAEFRQHAEAAARSRDLHEAELVCNVQRASKAIAALQSQKEIAEDEAQQLRTEMEAVRARADLEVRRVSAEAQARAENELQSVRAECEAKANELVGLARADVERQVKAYAVLRAELEEKRRAYERLVVDNERLHQRIRLFALPVVMLLTLAFVGPGWLTDKSVEQAKGQRADKQRAVSQSGKIQTASLPVPIPIPRPMLADFVQALPRAAPRPNAVPPPTAAPSDDSGMPADRLFHPQDKFTVDGIAQQAIMLRGNTVGHLEPNREYPVDEIYQSSPGSQKIYYHVAGGWVHGRLDELHCGNGCQEVWPTVRSAQDALAEDAFLLRAKTTRLSESDGEGLQPGATQMRAKCNIVNNPIEVDRQDRDHVVGFFIRDGEDANLLGDVPTLEFGDKVTVEDSYITAGYTHWVHVSADLEGHSLRQGWVSTSCLEPNTHAD